MARLLAVDTATDACSVALHVDGDTRERHEPGPRTHLQHLLEMVRSLLADAGLRLAELDALAFGQGPGSFTGLRICAATVQGLAFGAELPAVAVSSLQALALGALRRQRDAGSVAAALDARMGEVYWALYRRDGDGLARIGDERLCRPEALRWPADGIDPARCVGAGNGWRQPDAFQALPHARFAAVDAGAAVHASEVAELALVKWAAGETVDAAGVQPVYLRGADAWPQRASGAPS